MDTCIFFSSLISTPEKGWHPALRRGGIQLWEEMASSPWWKRISARYNFFSLDHSLLIVKILRQSFRIISIIILSFCYNLLNIYVIENIVRYNVTS